MATVSAMATTLFLGGWQAPWGLVHVWPGANEGYWPLLWFFGKVLLFIFMFIWLRGSLPRLRYDQFMALGWKVLIPLSLGWIILVATVRAVSAEGGIDRQYLLIGAGVVAGLFLILMFFGEGRDGRGGRVDRCARRRVRGRLPGPADAHRWRRPGCRRSADLRHLHHPAGHPHRSGPHRQGAHRWLSLAPSRSSSGTPWRGSASPSAPCSRRWSPSSTRSRRCPPPRGSTDATSSTAGPTGWRSASAASCAPGRARPTRSTSRVPPTATAPTASASAPVSATAASTRSTTCAASCAASASRPARPGRSR